MMQYGGRQFASFRDPAGFVFFREGNYYRQVSTSYQKEYTHFISSGLYDRLIEAGLLLPHTEVDHMPDEEVFKVLLPEQLLFVSYPYEWSFDMLKDAALLTLRINQIAIGYGMVLKDASSYNVQFKKGLPVFIDTLSFSFYDPAQPWNAYRQFCQHFLFPLFIQRYTGTEAMRWLAVYLDGIPLNICTRLMPMKSVFNLSVLLHIKLQSYLSGFAKGSQGTNRAFTQKKMELLLNGLSSTVSGLKLKNKKTGWHDYYTKTIHGDQYLDQKTKIVFDWVVELRPATMLDMGANTGHFSFLFADKVRYLIAADADSASVNELYSKCKKTGLPIFSVVVDLSNPSPSIGWNNTERESFLDRTVAETGLFLALIHHLFFVYAIPFHKIVEVIKRLCKKNAIVEFVLADDQKVREISSGKHHLISGYSLEAFEEACIPFLEIEKKIVMEGWDRVLYLFKIK